MKLHIRNTAWIGDPIIGAEVEIKAKDKVFDIEIIKEPMTFQGTNFGIRPAIIKATTTSADNFKSQEELGTFGVDAGVAGIWNANDDMDNEWSQIDGIDISNQNGELCDGLVITSGLGDGRYAVYVKRDGDEITDFVIDFHDVDFPDL